MQKVSYMGNGSTTEFYFNFPYFETSNVVVTKNGASATGYNIIGNSGGLDADFPFVGGKVVFDIAPTSLDSITIARQLPLARIADYQPLTQITPTTLNQDLNYLMEVIKDRKDELTDLITKYSEIADKESTEVILSRISAIHEEIADIDAKIRTLGDISTLRTDVTTNTNNIATNTSDITNLKDAANFSETGCAAISHMSMPSDRYVDLTLGASGATYTAPANGYIYWNGNFNNTSGNLKLNGPQIQATANSNGGVAGYLSRAYIPVSKNDIVTINYENINDTYTFKFIYANGAQ